MQEFCDIFFISDAKKLRRRFGFLGCFYILLQIDIALESAEEKTDYGILGGSKKVLVVNTF